MIYLHKPDTTPIFQLMADSENELLQFANLINLNLSNLQDHKIVPYFIINISKADKILFYHDIKLINSIEKKELIKKYIQKHINDSKL